MSTYTKEKRAYDLNPRVFIYSLSDPATQSVRYVGATRFPRTRLCNHCNEKRELSRTPWLQSLKDRGLKPVMRILETCTEETWAEREIHWIQHHRSIGCDLANDTDGGRGAGVNPKEERIEQIREMNRKRVGVNNPNFGRLVTTETRRKLSAALRKSARRIAVKRTDTGQVFKSVSEAAKAMNTCTAYISRSVLRGCTVRGVRFVKA